MAATLKVWKAPSARSWRVVRQRTSTPSMGSALHRQAIAAPRCSITADGKGVVMLRKDLREATKKPAEKGSLATRPADQGREAERKRMATVAAVYTAEPFVRPEVRGSCAGTKRRARERQTASPPRQACLGEPSSKGPRRFSKRRSSEAELTRSLTPQELGRLGRRQRHRTEDPAQAGWPGTMSSSPSCSTSSMSVRSVEGFARLLRGDRARAPAK